MIDRSTRLTHRLAALRRHLAPHQLFLISAPNDVRYFTDFTTLVATEREAFLAVLPTEAHLFYAYFSPYSPTPPITAHQGSAINTVSTFIASLKESHHLTECIIDETDLVVHEYHALQAINGMTVKTGVDRYIRELRMVKDTTEIAALTKANKLTAQTMRWALSSLKVGLTEQAVCTMIEARLEKLGCRELAFPTVVAFGAHSALPHHQPTTTKLTKNTVVLLDFGGVWQGYRADMTRTVWFGGKPPAEFTQVENVVLDAYQTAHAMAETHAKIIITASDVDHAARDIIAEAGYGSRFIHTTGHGVGLDIHEQPSLNSSNPVPLKPGMVVTIEPGIYLPRKWGYRHENSVLLTEDGSKELVS